ncbi:MAG: single-stranded-DNA-specific exonuclease RecJ [Clostridia bacterium]|nr:single-stranded-DNA-specific exonuclease RecJ [Clostridia bacterium]
MQYLVKTQNTPLTDGQRRIAKTLGISDTFMRLLVGRGMKEEELGSFLKPSVDRLSSPFEIDGMNDAVKRVQSAIERGEKILIFGDYDCDGICAVSILMLYLRDRATVTYFIPDRNRDGYGMSVSTLERVICAQKPNLVITVDCGITAVEEARYLKSQGIDLIVTDHHEPQAEIPDCIVVDPKVKKNGFYELCGAGVALKLVEALSNREEACKYLDIAAIATIADVVPLKEDNRIIAYYGLKQMSTSPRKGIKMLLGEDAVSSQSIMFRVAPRMNAAGRLNSAMKVVGLFLETDYFMLKSLSDELARDNTVRQELCESTVREAKEMLRGVDFAEVGIIILCGENWEQGVLGIAAARLVEEFKRPAVLFAKNGDKLKGSARSVCAVNIFELFLGLSKYFTSFGGHAQAAGVSLLAKDFEEFKAEANRQVLEAHSLDEFMPPVKCEMELPLDFDFLPFTRELELLEPTGYGNPRPNFLITGENLRFDRIGFSKHVKCSTKKVDLLGFSDFSDKLYARVGKANFEATLDINCFRNILTAQGILRSVSFEDISLEEDEARCLNLHHLGYGGSVNLPTVDINYVNQRLQSPLGTIIVCFSKSEYEGLCAMSDEVRKLQVAIGSSSSLNPCNCVVICPNDEFDFSYYNNVIIAGKPLTSGYIKHIYDNCKNCVSLTGCEALRMSVSDDTLRSIYKAIAQVGVSKSKLSNMRELYVQVCARYKVDESVFLLAMKIFSEIDLVKISDRGILTVNRKSVRLADSAAYNQILHI